MKMQTLPLLIVTALTLQQAHATLLVHEPFLTGGAPNYTVDATIKSTGPTSMGFSGNWNDPTLAPLAVDFMVRSPGLSYTSGSELEVTGGALEHYRNSGSASSKTMTRSLSYNYNDVSSTSDLWISYLFTYDNSAANTAFTLRLSGSGRNLDFSLAANVLTVVSSGGAKVDVPTGTLTENTTYMVLLRAMDDASSSFDDFNVWLNPAVSSTIAGLGSPLAPAGRGIIRELGAGSAANSTMTPFTTFNLVANLSNGQSFQVDEFRMGSTLADVMPVVIPEPGTLALLGIALGAMLLFRRRR